MRPMEFDDILNECLERIMRGETVDQCLARFPEQADKLKPLLDTGSQVRKAALVQPRPEFREQARLQFQDALNKIPHKRQTLSFFEWLRQPQWAAVTAFSLLLLLGSAALLLANVSMPDQPLYPVKLAVEKIQITLTPSAEVRGELYARMLERRIVEITRMAEENKTDKVLLLAGRLDSFAASIASSSPEAFSAKTAAPQAASAPAAAPVPTTPTAPAVATSPALPPQAPSFAAPAAAPMVGAAGGVPPAADTTRVTVQSENVAVPTATTLPLPQTNLPALQTAAANLAHLRDMLASAPASERPALQGAISAAEKTYQALVSYLGNK